jgi:hypothetical protein
MRQETMASLSGICLLQGDTKDENKRCRNNAFRTLRDILSELSDSWQQEEGHQKQRMRDIEIKLGKTHINFFCTVRQ